MDFIVSIMQWVNDLPFSEGMRGSFWMFPAFETIHVIAIVIVFGSITRLDMRLMGLIWRNRPVTEVAEEMLPWTWTSFVIAAIFGLMLWMSKPLTYFGIAFFDVKMVLILLAGINMLYFQFVTFRDIAVWDRYAIPPPAARVQGALSLGFWLMVLICGRLIGFV